jgi:hypothetical protein
MRNNTHTRGLLSAARLPAGLCRGGGDWGHTTLGGDWGHTTFEWGTHHFATGGGRLGAGTHHFEPPAPGGYQVRQSQCAITLTPGDFRPRLAWQPDRQATDHLTTLLPPVCRNAIASKASATHNVAAVLFPACSPPSPAAV